MLYEVITVEGIAEAHYGFGVARDLKITGEERGIAILFRVDQLQNVITSYSIHYTKLYDKGIRCPIELSTYFRINAAQSGQFERTLLIADQDSYVSYLEGCTAPQRDENQLHAAVVELLALDNAEIKYSTVQNWYAGDAEGYGGIYNFVTKRGKCAGRRSKISWTQVEAGAAITWKYPGCILAGDDSEGSFYSVAVTNNQMQADTGTKMVHP